ncbi:MAG: saccharopine dehydrogenase-like NADP-dependent oxidoreductase [Porticoccaceae bacterium]|jgi:saccharopine dehydrogenase-like NADP-dependent oxidoreductase
MFYYNVWIKGHECIGGMGRFAVKTLLEFDSITQVVIADRNHQAAVSFSESCNDSRSSPKGVDITQAESLAASLEGIDLVMNTDEPIYRFGKIVLQACIAAKVNYLDICDDWEPTLELLAMDQVAKDAGITAIIGMGATPGISNLMGAKVIAELDTVDEVYTGWCLDYEVSEQSGPEPSAADVHGMQQLTGKIKYFWDGKPYDDRPLKKIMLDYSDLGKHKAYTVGHPEPLTFSHF